MAEQRFQLSGLCSRAWATRQLLDYTQEEWAKEPGPQPVRGWADGKWQPSPSPRVGVKWGSTGSEGATQLVQVVAEWECGLNTGGTSTFPREARGPYLWMICRVPRVGNLTQLQTKTKPIATSLRPLLWRFQDNLSLIQATPQFVAQGHSSLAIVWTRRQGLTDLCCNFHTAVSSNHVPSVLSQPVFPALLLSSRLLPRVHWESNLKQNKASRFCEAYILSCRAS